MATTTIRMLQLIDINASYLNSNPYLYTGELAFEADSGQVKVGRDAAWGSTPYFNPAVLNEVLVTASTLSINASHCGTTIHVRNAASFTLTLDAGDLADSNTPAGITDHFPNRGYFYVSFDHDVTSVTTFDVTTGADCQLWYNEYGVSGNQAISTNRNINNSDACQGKLYKFINLGGTNGRWQMYEMDTKTAWVQAKTATVLYPSYGGMSRASPITFGSGTVHTLTFQYQQASNTGVDTTGYATGALDLDDDGIYRIYGLVVCNQSPALVNPALKIYRDGSPITSGETQLVGTFDTSPFAIYVEVLENITAPVTITLRLVLSSAAAAKVDSCQLIAEKVNLNVAG